MFNWFGVWWSYTHSRTPRRLIILTLLFITASIFSVMSLFILFGIDVIFILKSIDPALTVKTLTVKKEAINLGIFGGILFVAFALVFGSIMLHICLQTLSNVVNGRREIELSAVMRA